MADDPYNFSEIEKIQMDIERDLMLHKEPDTVELPVVETFSNLPATTGENSSVLVTDTTINTTESFYTETIKQKHFPLPQRLSSFRRKVAILLLICTLGTGTLGVGIGFGIVFLQSRIGASNQAVGNNLHDIATIDAMDSTRFIFGNDGNTPIQEGSLSDVVRLVDPAVVRITTTPLLTAQQAPPFFGNDITPNIQSLGRASGVIFAKDEEKGLVFIVTNEHVISGVRSIDVSIMEADPITAQVVGRSVNADVAVLSVPLADVRRVGIQRVSIAAFGDSDAMQVGDVVLAIGNAMGEGNSTTSGIISAGEKETEIDGRNLRVLQTDAAINPGNSGGPLVNKQGQVIGINTVSLTMSRQAIEGMGFSIPSNVVKPIIEEIMNAPPVPFLGIEGFDVNDNIAAEFGILPIGVYINRIVPGTSAELAGLQRRDIITSFGGRTIFDMEQLRREISSTNIGDVVEITIIRGRNRAPIVLQVTIGVSP
ncbi:MAG: trypsin-like peptidase domain-containing protein [Defluviitaleaceae bacterium]|nr:trypsin-like peptidase domain-containing protein [Defluviitaleaceae bacterium]